MGELKVSSDACRIVTPIHAAQQKKAGMHKGQNERSFPMLSPKFGDDGWPQMKMKRVAIIRRQQPTRGGERKGGDVE